MIPLLQISKLINGRISGDQNLAIKGVCDIEVGKDSCIAYLKNSSFEKYIKSNKSSVFIVDKDIDIKKYDKTFLIVDNPSISFIKVLDFFKSKKTLKKTGISNNAIISSKAKIGKNVYIGPNVCIEDKVIISDNVSIHSGVHIGFNSTSRIYSEILYFLYVLRLIG